MCQLKTASERSHRCSALRSIYLIMQYLIIAREHACETTIGLIHEETLLASNCQEYDGDHGFWDRLWVLGNRNCLQTGKHMDTRRSTSPQQSHCAILSAKLTWWNSQWSHRCPAAHVKRANKTQKWNFRCTKRNTSKQSSFHKHRANWKLYGEISIEWHRNTNHFGPQYISCTSCISVYILDHFSTLYSNHLWFSSSKPPTIRQFQQRHLKRRQAWLSGWSCRFSLRLVAPCSP